ncbi:MAG: PepSY domain-containing protein [Bradyrhizobium sp.]|uniref:PepSY domain-containing protein n=1 Tax=Bradyrhizobium sp. TaxID=376 RepID=UPI00290392FD|nr:PepSY domain-containing protein [Bradyrhizobium sp.]MDU1807133.1 PepSY domain-containing protein [Bradyrhizobium sp.]
MFLMSKKHLFALIIWSATLVATGADADVPQTVDASTPGAETQGDTDEAVVRRVIAQFHTTHVPLSRAMAIAERLHEGSRTTDINFDISGPPVYRVRTVRNERVWENVVDANTGGIAEKETVASLKELDREDLANIVALKWIKQELSEAVQVAEKATAGNALAGGLTRQDGKLTFVVVVASGDDLKEVMLEPPKVEKLSSNRHYAHSRDGDQAFQAMVITDSR